MLIFFAQDRPSLIFTSIKKNDGAHIYMMKVQTKKSSISFVFFSPLNIKKRIVNVSNLHTGASCSNAQFASAMPACKRASLT